MPTPPLHSPRRLRAAGLLLVAGLLGACADAKAPLGGGGGGGGGGAARIDGGLADAGVASSDAGRGTGDASAPFYDAGVADGPGIRLGAALSTLVGVSPDEREVYLLDLQGQLVAADPDTGGGRVVAEAPSLVYGPRRHIWLFEERAADRPVAPLAVYTPGEPRARSLSSSTAWGLLYPSSSGDRALVATRPRSSASAGWRADLGLVDAESGAIRTVAAGVRLGSFDADRRRFACLNQGAITSTRTALVVACDGPRRDLVVVDLEHGGTATIASDVLNFLLPSPDGRFALFADAAVDVFAVSADAETVVPLAESSTVTTVAALGDGRFVYVTTGGSLKVAEWPWMVPRTLQAFGVRSIRAASTDGRWVAFSQAGTTLGDLFVVDTRDDERQLPRVLASTPDAYPADDAFDAPSQHALWYEGIDADGIGALRARRLEGNGASWTLRDRALRAWRTDDPRRMMLLGDPRRAPDETLVTGELAVVDLDGGGATEVLARGVDAARILPFPSRRRVMFRIPSGPQAGVWVRATH